MRFGKFLIREKLATPENVLLALGEQRRRRSFLPLAAVGTGRLTASEALKYWDAAGECEPVFFAMLEENRHITVHEKQELHDRWTMSAPRIGEMLVVMGVLDADTLQRAWDQYESSRSSRNQACKA